MNKKLEISCCCMVLLALSAVMGVIAEEVQPLSDWDSIASVNLKCGLKVFWNVGGKDREFNHQQAAAHGFELVHLLNTYSDYPGRQKEKIFPNENNPWKKPPFYERIIRRNIGTNCTNQIFVHDVEFHFEEDLDKLWADPEIRKLSGVKDRAEFKDAYYREWGSWYALPCQWAKEAYPKTPIGIYGPQPFKRDYWGVAGKDARQIDGTHKSDADLWKYINPSVDFVIASIYCFYDNPGLIVCSGRCQHLYDWMIPAGAGVNIDFRESTRYAQI